MVHPSGYITDDAVDDEAPRGVARLGADECSLLAACLPLSDLLCFSLTCRAFDEARRGLGLAALRTHQSHYCQSLPLLRWAVANLGWLDERAQLRACEWAARSGSMPVLLWLRGHGALCSENAVAAAAAGGHTELVRTLVLDWQCPADWRACAAAAESGCLDTLRCARVGLRLHWDELCCASAAGGGHLALLQWCRHEGCPWDGWTPAAAAAGGHVRVLEWLHAQHDKPIAGAGQVTANAAWRTGHRRRGLTPAPHLTPNPPSARPCPRAQVCAAAAGSGQLDALRRARVHGYGWDPSACAEAAAGGHLSVLQWCRAEGAPWDESCCAAAAGAGRLRVLQWCVAQGCPWDWTTLSRARAQGHAQVERWCVAQGCPEPHGEDGNWPWGGGFEDGGFGLAGLAAPDVDEEEVAIWP